MLMMLLLPQATTSSWRTAKRTSANVVAGPMSLLRYFSPASGGRRPEASCSWDRCWARVVHAGRTRVCSRVQGCMHACMLHEDVHRQECASTRRRLHGGCMLCQLHGAIAASHRLR